MPSQTGDPETQARLDEFQQRLSQTGNFYRGMFAAIYEDRIKRDLEAMRAPPEPLKVRSVDPIVGRAVRTSLRVGKRAGTWFFRRLVPGAAKSTVNSAASTPGSPTVIEGSYRIITEEEVASTTPGGNPRWRPAAPASEVRTVSGSGSNRSIPTTLPVRPVRARRDQQR